MWKLAIVIGEFIKFVVWILMEMYYFPQNLPKMIKSTWKCARLFVKSKKQKNRNIYKIRSHRAENGKFKVFEVVEKPTSGGRGKQTA